MYAAQISPSRRFLRFFAVFFLQLILFTSISLYLMVEWGGGSIGEKTFQPGMSIASVPVGGNTYEEARQKMMAAIQTRQKTDVKYVLDGQVYPIDLSKLNVTFDIEATMKQAWAQSNEQGGFFSRIWGKSEQKNDVPLQVAYDRSELSKQLAEIGKKVNRPAVSATGIVSGDKITIVPEVIGYRTNIDRSLSLFDRFMMNDLTQTSGELKLEVEQDVPEILKSDVESIDYMLAKTSFPVASADMTEKENMSKLIARLNGSIVFPNQIFSFWEKTGPYTEENGYIPVPVHSDEEAPDPLGGGATQIATALYQAFLKSHLPVIERHAAARPVSYTEAGLEAMVSGDGLDLRFANNTKKPVFIHSEIKNNLLSVSLFSGKGDVPVTILSTEKGEAIEPDTIIRVDKELAPNQEMIERKGSEGFTVTAYQSWREKNGNEIKQKISDDYYKPLHNIIAVGPVYEKDKEKDRSAQGDLVQGEAMETPGEDTPSFDGTSAEAPPPDIPVTPDSTAGSSSGNTGEPRIVNGIIYQN